MTSSVSPKTPTTEQRGAVSPKTLHRIAATIEMVTWTLLILGMILKYSGVTDGLVPIAGPIHGFGFLCFAAITVLLWVNNRWSLGLGVLGLLVSVIPWAALPFTLWADRRGHLDGGWRYLGTDDRPANIADWGLAQMVRHPVRTILIVLVIIAVVFTLLLNMGQPYDPDAIVDTVS
ncbi:hypothetical protein A605_08110 [Corynebacterium halotolerans YIM 70093 = DSM 44683]|uniref:DUF3817 domain-containing protein n=1 Tax=Corynebacterium halotolerans YIM 70093 = DSM 44683 TaxID=1121362 RepID=M1MY16_9CORY|nr:hypothetical protein A605_08110 [Corynebacterium halotolerans YIM 70093 = DSM 44683]